MDYLIQLDGGILIAFGSEKGNIFLMQDWEEHPKQTQVKNNMDLIMIHDIQF